MKIKIDSVVIRQINQKLRKPSILQDCWQVLVSAHHLSHQLGSELRPGDLVQVRDMDESDTFTHKHLSVVDQVQGILERHFDELFGLKSCVVWQDLCVKHDLVPKFDPHLVFFGELLVIHVALFS